MPPAARCPGLLWLALAMLAAAAGCRSSRGLAAGSADASADTAAVAADVAPAVADAAGSEATADDAGPDAAAPAADLAPAAFEAGPPGVGQVQCGSGSIPEITSYMEHLVVTPDGTIYYSDGGSSIGRIRPGQPEETGWVRASSIVGLTYDPRRRTIYAGLRGRLRMLVVRLTATGLTEAELERPLGSGAGGIYGMTLGEDGAIYYLDEWNGSIYRTDPDTWTSTQVATLLPNRPHALAFGPDGWLYVTQLNGPDVWRVKLEGNREVAREKFATVGFPHGKGIAFDEHGHLYVTTEGRLSQFDRSGTLVATQPSSAGGLDFGAGYLACTNLYVGAPEGLRVHPLDVRGMNVPWHRAP